ncbi:MAG: hypothetical protein R3A49_06920 [Acidimicrobiia bacterium]
MNDGDRATPESDPILARRAQLARWVSIGQRVGYLALVVSIVVFVIAFALDFPGWAVTTVIVSLLTAIVVLPVPIVMGYGLKAAERADRGLPDGH